MSWLDKALGDLYNALTPNQTTTDPPILHAFTGTPQPKAKDEGEFGDSKYKFTPVTDPNHSVEDYTATGATGAVADPADYSKFLVGKKGVSEDLPVVDGQKVDGGEVGKVGDPSELSDKEYNLLTDEASKGNKLAQEILVKGKYKAKDYPTLAQDTEKIEQPFVSALSGLPAFAQTEQASANATVAPYDFSNAESQVNSILKENGSSLMMSPNAQTSQYMNKLNQIVGGGANNLSNSTLGLPSIDQALSGLGPAAKLSEKASPYASLLAALLSHEQYETVYGGVAPSSSGDPAWLQNLIAAVTGTTSAGGLVSPSIAAGGAGSIPSTAPSPTGSNA